MDQAQAIDHLRKACVPINDTDAALTAEWQAAKALLGPPVQNAGLPNMQPIPLTHQGHLTSLQQAPWAAPLFQGAYAGVTFQMVEVDPLLSFQFSVDDGRSGHHCQGLSAPPTIDEMLPLCLPLTPPN